jgi:hypothetical protein
MKNSVLFVLAAMTAVAQTNSGGQGVVMLSAPSPAFARTSGFFGGDPMSAVAGHPYSGLQETETVQTLADGTHVTQGGQKVMYYRDSMGRTRSERTSIPPPGFLSEGKPPVFIEIHDPVAGYRYTLDSLGHTAYRAPTGPVPGPNIGSGFGAVRAVLSAVPLPAPQIAPQIVQTGDSSSRAIPQQSRPETTVESLGTQTMEGVLAEGSRTTTVWPAGIFGNDRPITTTNETWTWRELGITILTKTSDPRSGETTMKMTGISQAEPDPSLFQIPAGYEINDPSGAVSK